MSYIDELRRSWAFLDALHWIGTDGQQVWTTADGGATFTVEPSTGLPLPLAGADMHFVDGEHAWASAVEGVPGRQLWLHGVADRIVQDVGWWADLGARG